MDEEQARVNALLLRRIANAGGNFKNELVKSATDEVLELIPESENIALEEMSNQLANLGLEKDAISQVLDLIGVKGIPSEFFAKLEDINLPDGCTAAVEELKLLSEYLNAYNVAAPVVFDASMARGLDYYTGIVFEAFDSTGEIVRAIFGGGRYSNLVEILGGSPLTGVGFGMGETVLMELMKLRDVFDNMPEYSPDIYLAPIKEEPIPTLIDLGQRLKDNFKIITNAFSWKLGRHFEYADDLGAKLVLLLGQRDLDNGVVSIREMESSDQHTFDFDETLEDNLQNLLISLKNNEDK